MSGAPFAILASGTGSNALALHTAVRDGRIAAPLACIASDRADAPVIERAGAAGVEALVVDPAGFPDRDAFEQGLVRAMRARSVEHVVLAGYMRICGPTFLGAYGGRTINLHPSLLPAFPGRDAIGDAMAAGAIETGVTVHFIDDGIDTGPIICQAPIAVRPGETREQLATRIHAMEHRLLPIVVAGLVSGGVSLQADRSVSIDPTTRATLRAGGARLATTISAHHHILEAPPA